MRFKNLGLEGFAPSSNGLERFKELLSEYLQALGEDKNQNERAIISNDLKPFLEGLGFEAHAGYKHKGNSEIDLALLKEGDVEVLIEAKKPENKQEMFSPNNPNCKALHECILYYLRERENANSNLKYIIITNFTQFYIFTSNEFKRYFEKNKKIQDAYQNLKKKNVLENQKDFYDDIGKILNAEFSGDLEGDMFNISLQGAYFDLQNDKHLHSACQILNRNFLHKEQRRDSNALNPKFYFELLYILGLKESNIKNKVLIHIDESQDKSFAKHLRDKIAQNHPQDSQDLLFEKTMSHIIIYLNRILFLKLIEANLLHFNDFDKSLEFLRSAKIPSFQYLEHLFFEVLAKPYENRDSDKGFNFLPYLNSSLFMKDEKELLELSTLDSELSISPFATTQTAYKNDEKVKFLTYLFDFLECFDFGKSVDSSSSDKLISSSVLGAMFEKLNGYKEGSFYTPNFITSYMCKQSLSKVVIDKFNAQNPKWNAKTLADIKDEIQNEKRESDDRAAIANKYIKLLESIKICDPAVGSGHFLVSALNEMVYIYYKLGLLSFDYALEIKDDEIYLKNGDENFAYKRPKSKDSQNHQIQIALFNLKKSIIENNLFGVDINPNSCNIARLRLWIELLKSAYYLEDSFKGQIHKLQTLPNIDINIKCGNSLISHFPTFEYDKNQNPEKYTFAWLKNQNTQFSQNFKQTLLRYNHLVQTYKEKLGDKQEIEKEIKELKAFFKDTLLKNSFTMESLEKKLKAFVEKYGDEVFDMDTSFGMEMIKIIRDKNKQGKGYRFQPPLDQLEPSPIDKKGQDLLNEIYKAYLEIENLKNQQTFEWRFEFPEVLDLRTFEDQQEKAKRNNEAKQARLNLTTTNISKATKTQDNDTFGDFVGFDLVIGNPPYGVELSPKERELYKKSYNTSQTNTAALFIYLSDRILTSKGINTLIVPKSLNYVAKWEGVREFISPSMYLLLDCGKAWDYVLLEMVIFARQKDVITQSYITHFLEDSSYKPYIELENQESLVQNEAMVIDKKLIGVFDFFPNNLSKEELEIGIKIKNHKNNLLDFAECFRGGGAFKVKSQHKRLKIPMKFWAEKKFKDMPLGA
ncbi:DUF7149 domain-containing protein [Helicobacter marmotae]|uniref:site-specific DNA-methyltransferase (adenine-specific) n=1 Tax=Helicobacter marmotae TaxID=152490 RepID=A0A3D8I7R6_9HELI|nr:DNA methyltransferase [Helicobacter marmotae]RDU61055.1 hypothetical protein CQA63_00675 [Helicobacter marmotae]